MNSQWLSMESAGGISSLPAHSFSFYMNSPLVFSRIGGRRWGKKAEEDPSSERGDMSKHKRAQRSRETTSSCLSMGPNGAEQGTQQARPTPGPLREPWAVTIPGFGPTGNDFLPDSSASETPCRSPLHPREGILSKLVLRGRSAHVLCVLKSPRARFKGAWSLCEGTKFLA